MIMDTVEKLPLYEGLIPYAKELSERFRTRNTEGFSFEVRFKEYETKADDKRKFEVHRHTIDLMMCFEGEEIIHICSEKELQPGEPLPDGGDGMKLIGAPRGSAVVIKPGCFVAIFPGEAHMVGGRTTADESGSISKWVVKLPSQGVLSCQEKL